MNNEPIDLRSMHKYCISCKSEGCLEEIQLTFSCKSRDIVLGWVNDLIVNAYQCTECQIRARARNDIEEHRERLAQLSWECRE